MELQCLDYITLSLCKVGLTLNKDLWLDFASLWILTHFPFFSVSTNLFSKLTLDHMRPARQGYSHSWPWNALQSNPCVIIPWFNASVSLFRLETDQNEWKVSTSSAEKCFHGNCQWSHEAELETLKFFFSLDLYCPIFNVMPRVFYEGRTLNPCSQFSRKTKAEFSLCSISLFSLG